MRPHSEAVDRWNKLNTKNLTPTTATLSIFRQTMGKMK